MSKLDSPIFSLSARGSLANLLTLRARGSATVASRKYHREEPQTIKQFLRKQAFSSAAKYWESLSDPTKESWRPVARQRHQTPYQTFVSDYLTNFPDLVFWEPGINQGTYNYPGFFFKNQPTFDFYTTPGIGPLTTCREFLTTNAFTLINNISHPASFNDFTFMCQAFLSSGCPGNHGPLVNYGDAFSITPNSINPLLADVHLELTSGPVDFTSFLPVFELDQWSFVTLLYFDDIYIIGKGLDICGYYISADPLATPAYTTCVFGKGYGATPTFWGKVADLRLYSRWINEFQYQYWFNHRQFAP